MATVIPCKTCQDPFELKHRGIVNCPKHRRKVTKSRWGPCKTCGVWFHAEGSGIVNCRDHRRSVTTFSDDDEDQEPRIEVVRVFPCSTCIHGRVQPASTTGWECIASLGIDCRPGTRAARYVERVNE